MRVFESVVAAALIAPVTLYAWPKSESPEECVGEAACHHQAEIEHAQVSSSASMPTMLAPPGGMSADWPGRMLQVKEQRPLIQRSE